MSNFTCGFCGAEQTPEGQIVKKGSLPAAGAPPAKKKKPVPGKKQPKQPLSQQVAEKKRGSMWD